MARKNNFISLAEHNPELVKEWNFEKNIDITPESISYGSAKKVHWKCVRGHEWEATLNDRTQGKGCPDCAQIQRAQTKRKNIVAKRGSLAENNPELAREWHPIKNAPLTPYDVSAGNDKKVWWRCLKDERHEWEAAINSRNSGVGCPICSGHKIVVGINDLATVRPDLAEEWNPTKNGSLKPTDVTLHNGRNIWWICKKEHVWNAKIANRADGNNCPFCSGKKVLAGFNDLETVMPSIAKEWNFDRNEGLTPKDVTAHSNKKVWWKCEKGHEWETSVSHRSNGRRCPKCFGESKTSFPEQAIFFYLQQVTTAYNRYMVAPKTEIDIYLPDYKIGIEYDGNYFHKGEKAEEREHRKQALLDSLGILLIRVREIEGQTSEHTIYSKPGANDIELTQTLNSLVAHIGEITQYSLEIDIDIARDRNKIYEQYIQSEKKNSLAEVNPELAKEWHPTKNGDILPEYVSIHFNKKVWWKCSEGHEWQASVNTRSKGHGCKECYNSKRKENNKDT